jgi:YVTN family beta-propeller protein
MNSRTGYALAVFLGLSSATVAGFSAQRKNEGSLDQWASADRTPVGRPIFPLGDQTGVGSFPTNMILSANGKFLIVTNTGYRENMSVLSVATGKVVSQLPEGSAKSASHGANLYFGLAAREDGDGTELLAVSHGSADTIELVQLSPEGKLSPTRAIELPKLENPLKIPLHVAGLAWSNDGSKLLAIANQSHKFNDFHGSVFAYNLAAGTFDPPIQVGSFPLSIASLKDGSVLVTNEGDRAISWLDPAKKTILSLETGEQPSYLSVNHAGTRAYVSNSNSDTVSEIDIPSRKVVKTILMRPGGLRGYPGVTPLGSALSPDDRKLYVAIADLNAVGVVDVASGRVMGYVPVGWYPTSVAVSPDGTHLFVANAKGTKAANPNGKPVSDWGKYDLNIIEGTVSMIPTAEIALKLKALTKIVQQGNHDFQPNHGWIRNPGIQHVVYIIKENRTYDQVLGDLPRANGDKSLTLFGSDVTPNQHALATRFGTFDNFYVCAEVSADGWNWSTSGEANEYTQRNVPYNYSGRGREYDFEGTNNGSSVDLDDRRDVAASPGGYLWDSVLKDGLTVRNYGMFLSFDVSTRPDGSQIEGKGKPDKKALVGATCLDFPRFDMRYPDSDAWVKLGLTPAKAQLLSYGEHNESSRISTWLREFKGYVEHNNLPNLTLIRLPRDHTSGTAANMSSPRAMVADNDYAVGEVVDAMSHSPYWKSCAIFVLEDDAQSGFDHVDCHRSNVLVVSPYLHKDVVDSSFYNTDSVLATIENLLKAKPNNQYLATARLFDLFDPAAGNTSPYDAIMPSKAILGEVNTRESYRAKDSAKLVSAFHEETAADYELNEILWRSIKGKGAALPKTPGTVWHK